MEELVELLKSLPQSSSIPSIEKYNPNILLICICKSQRYDLLESNNIKLNIQEDEYTKELIEYFLSDEDTSYELSLNGYELSEQDIKKIRLYSINHYKDDYLKLDRVMYTFFNNSEEIDELVIEYKELFKEILYSLKNQVPYRIKESQEFVTLILQERMTDLISNIDKYNSTNLIELSHIIKEGTKIKYYLGSSEYANNIFSNINDISPEEFYYLLTVLKEKSSYNRTYNPKHLQIEDLISNNIDYLIEMVSKQNEIPKCLVESSIFRDECIKRNRIDLAVKCILPKDITNNPELVDKYCKELNIDTQTFYSRIKWLLKYYEKNTDIFDTFIATMLKDNTFTIPEEHLERFINDPSIQILYTSLNEKELTIVNIILNKYNYQSFDISYMITNILENISQYKELINNIDISTLTDKQIDKLIALLQSSNNIYNITTLEELDNINTIKRNKYKEANNIINKKDYLLRYIFNIDLKEARIINNNYCYDRHGNILERIKNSELPKDLLTMLITINNIVETDKEDILDNYYQEFSNKDVYNSPIPLETYLRNKYAELYNKTLYKPQDKTNRTVQYNGQEVPIYIPQDNFSFMVHVVGTCTREGEEINTNYQLDWEGRPQIQDHFVACSYFNQNNLYGLRQEGSVTYGFSELEGSSIYGMGDTDIDSIGPYARSYNPSRELMDQGDRAHFLVPSIMIENTEVGYNEIVIERRNNSYREGNNFKRRPNYIIMSVDTIENKNNFLTLEELFNKELNMINEEDKKIIIDNKDRRTIRNTIYKYASIIKEKYHLELDEKQISMQFTQLVEKSKYYEESLRAAQEFNIPLIIIDRKLYFKKALDSSTYTEEEKISIMETYLKYDEDKKQALYRRIIINTPYDKLFPKEENNRRITIQI